MQQIDHTGERFGRWTVISIADKRRRGQLCFLCRCECGNEKILLGSVLRKGASKSCGCLRKEAGVERGRASKKHGEGSRATETPEYRAWGQMLCRCRNARHKQYKSYGGRGIAVCDRWLSYENFLADMGRRPTSRHSLDRINNDRFYTPENCRWATSQQQNNNRRQRDQWLRITIDGETKRLSEWLEIYNVSKSAYYKRHARGMSPEEALKTPMRSRAHL